MMTFHRSFSLLLTLLWAGVTAPTLMAQRFDSTLNKVPAEQRQTAQFQLLRPKIFSDSTLRKNYVGVRVGTNVSNIVGDAVGTGSLVGLRIGALYGRRLTAKSALQIEFTYSKQGAQQKEPELRNGILLDSGLTIASKYNYVALPISYKQYLTQSTGLFLEAGARIALLLNAELQGTGGSYTFIPNGRIDLVERLNPLDVGAFLGLGFTFHQSVDFTLRYHYIFTNHIDLAHPMTQNTGVFRNALLQASLGFYLDAKK